MQWVLLLLVAGFAASVDADCKGCSTISDIQNKENDLDFEGACSMYNEAYMCNAACKDKQRELTKFVSDVCEEGTDQLNGCGYEINDCINDLKAAKKAVEAKNKNVSCSDFHKFVQCSFKARAHCSNPNVTAFMDMLQIQVDETQLEIGCEGTCAQGFGECCKDLADVTTQHADIEHFKDMCLDLDKSVDCIKNLKDGVCKGEKNYKAAEEFTEQVKGKFSDVCDNGGKPTECMNDFVDCKKILDNKAKEGTPQQCKDLSSFVTCAERLPCHNYLLPGVKATVQAAESEETKAKCPVFGGCKERIEQCSIMATALNIMNKTDDLTTFCNDGAEIEACFNIVRSDKTCSVENAEASDFEERMFALFGSKCGNATVCYSELDKCYSLIADVTQDNTPKEDVCPKFEKWATCTDGAYRSDACVRVRQKLRDVDHEMMETYKTQCKNPKLCEENVVKCKDPITEAKKENKTSEEQFCPILRDAFSCINRLRQGVLCPLVNKNLAADEEALNAENPGCGGSKQLCAFNSEMCLDPVLEEDNKNPSNDEFCRAVSSSAQCLDGLRQTLACRQINGTLEKYERNLKAMEIDDCKDGDGNGSATVIASVSMLVAGFFALIVWN